jgi:hypothetical protein
MKTARRKLLGFSGTVCRSRMIVLNGSRMSHMRASASSFAAMIKNIQSFEDMRPYPTSFVTKLAHIFLTFIDLN